MWLALPSPSSASSQVMRMRRHARASKSSWLALACAVELSGRPSQRCAMPSLSGAIETVSQTDVVLLLCALADASRHLRADVHGSRAGALTATHWNSKAAL